MIILKSKSGASKHFLKSTDAIILQNVTKANLTSKLLPIKMQLTTNKARKLPIHPTLTLTASTAHVLPGMTNRSLLSIVQLCDHGYM